MIVCYIIGVLILADARSLFAMSRRRVYSATTE